MRNQPSGNSGLKFLSHTESLRARLASINAELEKLTREMNERESKGTPVHDLEKRQDELERQKQDIVQRMQDRWSA